MQKLAIDNIISTLAKTLLTNSDLFEELAKENAKRLNLNDLSYLSNSLHNPPFNPEIDPNDLQLGQWLTLCQYSIFELYYNLGLDAVDLLRDFAFGKYDWTQATALEVLCRLSIDGKISDTIIDEIDRRLDKMRYETHLYFARSLLIRAKRDKRFEIIIQQLKHSEFQEALLEVSEN
jgi:hypothetical protein